MMTANPTDPNAVCLLVYADADGIDVFHRPLTYSEAFDQMRTQFDDMCSDCGIPTDAADDYNYANIDALQARVVTDDVDAQWRIVPLDEEWFDHG